LTRISGEGTKKSLLPPGTLGHPGDPDRIPDSGSNGNAYVPSLAFNPNSDYSLTSSDAICSWYETGVSGQYRIKFAVWNHQTGWSPGTLGHPDDPDRIPDSGSNGDARYPSISFNPNYDYSDTSSDAICSWYETNANGDTGHYAIKFAVWNHQTGWSPGTLGHPGDPDRIPDSGDDGDARYPSLAFNPNSDYSLTSSDAICSWHETGAGAGGNRAIKFAIWNHQTGWSPGTLGHPGDPDRIPDSGSNGDAYAPSISFNPNSDYNSTSSDAICSWHEYSVEGQVRIKFAVWNHQTGWSPGPAFIPDSGDDGSAASPSLAFNPNSDYSDTSSDAICSWYETGVSGAYRIKFAVWNSSITSNGYTLNISENQGHQSIKTFGGLYQYVYIPVQALSQPNSSSHTVKHNNETIPHIIKDNLLIFHHTKDTSKPITFTIEHDSGSTAIQFNP